MPDSGEILLDGRHVHFRSPIDARRAGIETVYQDLAVAPAMTIAENLFLGRELRRPGCRRHASCACSTSSACCAESAAHMADLKIGIRSMTQAVETLSGGQRQCVAVARSAAFARHVVIMDEPTAALGVKEGGMVLELIRARARSRARRGADLAQHAARVRDRRPHPRRATRQARRGAESRRQISMSDTVAVMTGALRPEDLPTEAARPTTLEMAR